MMCGFVSYIKLADGSVRFLTGEELRTARGKKLMAATRSEYDVVGHRFTREYFDKDLVGNEGEDKEYKLSNKRVLPKKIIDAVKRGEFDHRVFYKEAADQFKAILTPPALKKFNAEETEIRAKVDSKRQYPTLANYSAKGKITNPANVKLADKLATLLMDYVKVRKNRIDKWK